MSYKILLSFVFLIVSSEALLGPCSFKNVSLMSPINQKPLVTPTNCGVTLNASELVTQPNVILHNTDESREKGESYTFMLLEEILDVRDTFKLHWLVSYITPLRGSLTANETSIKFLRYSKPLADPNRAKKFFLYVYKQNKMPGLVGPSAKDIELFAPQQWVTKNGNIIQGVVGGAEFYITPNRSQPAMHNTHGGPVVMPFPQQPTQHYPGQPQPQPGYSAPPQPNYPGQGPPYTAQPGQQPHPGQQPQPGQQPHPNNQQPTVINNYYGKVKDEKKKKNSAMSSLPTVSLVAIMASAAMFRV